MMTDNDDTLTSKSGTNFYFSPEACSGKPYRGKPLDIWACGVVLYRLAAGKFPFSANTVPDLYLKIQNEEPDYTGFNEPYLLDL